MLSSATAKSPVAKGWRKPVPKYIPSPPLSPRQGLAPQDGVESRNMEIGRESDMPPLPDNWKYIIDQAFNQPIPSASWKGSIANAAEENKPVFKVTIDPAAWSSIHTSSSTDSTFVDKMRRPSLPQLYHPPTPPLPSNCPKSWMPSSAGSLNEHSPYRMIYPDPPLPRIQSSHEHLVGPIVNADFKDKNSLASSSEAATSIETPFGLERTESSWALPVYKGWRRFLKAVEPTEHLEPHKIEPSLPSPIAMHSLSSDALNRLRRREESMSERSCWDMVRNSIVGIGRWISLVFRKRSTTNKATAM